MHSSTSEVGILALNLQDAKEKDFKKHVPSIANKKNVMKFRLVVSKYSSVGYKCDREGNILPTRF